VFGPSPPRVGWPPLGLRCRRPLGQPRFRARKRSPAGTRRDSRPQAAAPCRRSCRFSQSSDTRRPGPHPARAGAKASLANDPRAHERRPDEVSRRFIARRTPGERCHPHRSRSPNRPQDPGAARGGRPRRCFPDTRRPAAKRVDEVGCRVAHPPSAARRSEAATLASAAGAARTSTGNSKASRLRPAAMRALELLLLSARTRGLGAVRAPLSV
jgi:hypothetical protein